MTLNGDITTANTATNTVTITGPALLGAGITIDTNNATTDGAIEFTSSIDNTETLSLVGAHEGTAHQMVLRVHHP